MQHSILRKIVITSLTGLLTAAGCQDQTDPSAAPVGPQDERLTQREVYNLSKLQDAPTAVQLSFGQDHPNATIETVQTLSPRNAPLLYQISFTQDGQSRAVTYTREGERFEARQDAPQAPAQPPAPTTPEPGAVAPGAVEPGAVEPGAPADGATPAPQPSDPAAPPPLPAAPQPAPTEPAAPPPPTTQPIAPPPPAPAPANPPR